MGVLSRNKTLQFITDFINDHGIAPTMSEIASGIGIQSRGVAHRYVKELEDQGLIRLSDKKHRSIEIINSASNSGCIPLLGRIAAGLPIEAIPDRRSVDIANIFLRDDRYALEVRGDSMIEEGILDGDVVVCERSESARDGQIVVALVDNEEATLKRFRRNKDHTITLVPANSAYKPMTYSSNRIKVQGIFVGLLRFLSP